MTTTIYHLLLTRFWPNFEVRGFGKNKFNAGDSINLYVPTDGARHTTSRTIAKNLQTDKLDERQYH